MRAVLKKSLLVVMAFMSHSVFSGKVATVFSSVSSVGVLPEVKERRPGFVEVIMPEGTVVVQPVTAVREKLQSLVTLECAQKAKKPMTPKGRRIYPQETWFFGADLGLEKERERFDTASTSSESLHGESDYQEKWLAVRASLIAFQKELFAFREQLRIMLEYFLSKAKMQRHVSAGDLAYRELLIRAGSDYQMLDEAYKGVLKDTLYFGFGVVAKEPFWKKYTSKEAFVVAYGAFFEPLYFLAEETEKMCSIILPPTCRTCYRSLDVAAGETSCCGSSIILPYASFLEDRAARLDMFFGQIEQLRATLMQCLQTLGRSR